MTLEQSFETTSVTRSIPTLLDLMAEIKGNKTFLAKGAAGHYEDISGCKGFRHIYAPQLAKGGIEFYELETGLWIIIVDMTTEQVMLRQHSFGGMLVLSAVLKADIDIMPASNQTKDGFATGTCMLYGIESDGFFETVYDPKRTLKWVSVIIDPDCFFDATHLSPQDIPEAIQAFFTEKTPLARRNIPMTREEALVATQMVECRLTGSYRSAFLKAKTLELLCHVFSGFKLSSNPQTGLILTAKDFARIERAKRYIQSSLSDRPNIEELAYAVDLSRHKLQLGFKQLYGDTVAHVREKMRLEYALNLIRTSEMSMIQIALETGYGHQASFTRAFKAAYGVSPIEVRRSDIKVSATDLRKAP